MVHREVVMTWIRRFCFDCLPSGLLLFPGWVHAFGEEDNARHTIPLSVQSSVKTVMLNAFLA
jgi:hypothetical protein